MNPELSGDETAAALSLVTNMSEGLMPQMEQPMEEVPMEQPKETQEKPTEKPEVEEKSEEIDKKYETWMENTESMIDKKLEAMKNELIGVIKGAKE